MAKTRKGGFFSAIRKWWSPKHYPQCDTRKNTYKLCKRLNRYTFKFRPCIAHYKALKSCNFEEAAKEKIQELQNNGNESNSEIANLESQILTAKHKMLKASNWD